MKDDTLKIVRTRQYQKLDGAMLKWIAMITMVIDHLGAVVLFRLLKDGSIPAASRDVWQGIYDGLRMVGRTAFPIFCFFIVEGFFHTRCVWRYMFRLGVFALISEVPFDLAVSALLGEDWRNLTGYMWENQNVMVTLLLGLFAIQGMDGLRKRLHEAEISLRTGVVLTGAGWAVIGAVAVWVGALCRADYGGYGVLCILVMYLCYPERELMALLGYGALFRADPGSLTGFLFLLLYNGERGKQPKYLFYGFYPLHLAVLFGVSVVLAYFL